MLEAEQGPLYINLGPSLDCGTNECLKLNLRQLGCLLYVIGFWMDQMVTAQAWMRGNVGGIRDATRELGLRSPICFIKQFGNKISQCFHWDSVPSPFFPVFITWPVP